jgi:hypothetical protein
MKKLLLSILISFCAKTLTAQTTETTVITNEKGDKITDVKIQGLGRRGYYTNKLLYRGSILFNESFEMATLKPKDTKAFDAAVLFNLYKEELVTKVEDKEVLLSKMDFSLRGQNFITHEGHYYELLFENENVKILKKYNCTLKLNRGHGGLNMGGIYDGDFVRNESYFFLFTDEKMKEFTLDKSSVLSVLEKRNDLLAQPINTDTMQINKIEDVIALLK